METRTRFLGHAIHPMLIVFPLGLLAASLVFDIVRMATGDGTFGVVAFWMIAAGVIGGLIAAVFGFMDWLSIPTHTRARAIGLWHGATNVVVVVIFAVGWLLRRPDPAHAEALPIVLSFIGVGLALVGGWLGGELVERLGIGIAPGAHVNAPSSLSARDATETAGHAQPGPHARPATHSP